MQKGAAGRRKSEGNLPERVAKPENALNDPSKGEKKNQTTRRCI